MTTSFSGWKNWKPGILMKTEIHMSIPKQPSHLEKRNSRYKWKGGSMWVWTSTGPAGERRRQTIACTNPAEHHSCALE